VTDAELNWYEGGETMKKIVGIVGIILLAAVSFAVATDKPDTSEIPLGAQKGNTAGCFCCVKQTCVVARNEADCKKIGGVKIKKCADCEKKAGK
jgi:hypothetical protein